jgi:hypothetical protein
VVIWGGLRGGFGEVGSDWDVGRWGHEKRAPFWGARCGGRPPGTGGGLLERLAAAAEGEGEEAEG